MPTALSARRFADVGAHRHLAAGRDSSSSGGLVYFLFSAGVIAAVFGFLRFTTFGMVVRAGMADRGETVGLLGINIDRRFTIMFGLAAVVAGLAGVMYTRCCRPTITRAWISWC